ncbi:Trehalose utilization [Aquisphaera giovannonii]|uniref:Trehalose utilization n=1 Tax=Aquisphaera giovannonii TaxID=406548 RepID=A0A5B9VZG9_9BACT|nr:ThuA domain-containing protein [Aquisphaera giovannonii]QEH33357.1 Trehalose utilization [Aquisphaera giovannonii]
MRTRIAFACLYMSMAVISGPMSPARAQKEAPGGAKVYLLTGGKRQHHGYRDQAFYLAEQLENTGRYEVTMGEDAAILETPAIRKYDLIIANADRRDPEFKYSRAQQEALLDFVRSGRGYVSIHGADNAAADWLPEWKAMLGGVFSHFGLPDGRTKKGEYQVKIADRSSPITAGLDDFRVKDELYYHMQMAKDVKPLATVEYQGETWPIAWTNVYGSGRVFHLVFGHRDFGPGKDDPIRNPSLGRLVLQGVDWVAAGKEPAAAANEARRP